MRAHVVEVGPRDGLQNESQSIPTDIKVAYVDALSEAGLPEIEVSAFVSPQKVPQLVDAEDVLQRIRRKTGVVYAALVPNERGMERALATELDKIAVFTAASETFNQKNINASIEGAFARFPRVISEAKRARMQIRGYVSTAFWCPYEGKVQPERVVEVSRRLVEMGVEEVSIGDTIGKATPDEVKALLEQLLRVIPVERVALHFHDTFGNAPENVRAGLSLGVTRYDSSAGGIGGCPYAPHSRGNVGTETLVLTLHDAGYETGVDLAAVDRARQIVAPYVGHPLSSLL